MRERETHERAGSMASAGLEDGIGVFAGTVMATPGSDGIQV
ncbi:unnamed protein product, partial [Ectocarpus fasciculatus]